MLKLLLVFFNLCILIFYNAYPWRYFFYFEFRQKVHIVYFWPHLLFGAQNFCKNWNVVPYSYYDGKVLISYRWRSYITRKFKKSVFSIFFNSNLVVHLNEHVLLGYGAQRTEFFVMDHSLPFYPIKTQKNQDLKKWKKAWRYHHFTYVYHK